MPEIAPTFTVVVPLFNTERYIAETLDCIRAQTFTDFEVVVDDDASMDGGPEIVRAYIGRDPRIRLVTQENRGLAGARNTGIRHARGRYIALLDADDLWAVRKLELHKAHLDACPDVGVSYAGSIFIDENGLELGITQSPRTQGVDAAHILCRNPVGNGSAGVLRRSALEDVQFTISTPAGDRVCWFDESFRQSEDIELWTRIAVTTRWRFAGLPLPLTYYRVNNSGLSANISKQFESWERMRAKLASAAPEFVQQFGSKAEAYQHRYLARRAAMSGDGKNAVRAMSRALSTDPRILVEEPGRTVLTWLVCLLALVLPARGLSTLKQWGFASSRFARETAEALTTCRHAMAPVCRPARKAGTDLGR